MLANFSPTELTIFAVVVLIACYFVGTFVHEIVDQEGFGINGNMVVLTIGTFFGLWLSMYYRAPQNNEILLVIWGVSGAFGTLATLILFKIGARRLGL